MLFNTAVFGSKMFNGGATLAEIFSMDPLVFDGFSLSDGSSMIMENVTVSGANRELIGGKVPRGDGFYTTDDQFGEYVIEAKGYVKASTAALLDAELDTIRKNLRKRERPLDYIDANGTVKRFTATLMNMDELFADRQRYHITICPWVARFVARTPFPTSRSYSSTSLPITSSPTNHTVHHLGTGKGKPVITVNFSAASSVTAVRVTNNTTGEYAEYTGAVSTDLLVFDSENVMVKKNATQVAFSGVLPRLEPDANLFTISITGSSFTCYCTFAYKTAFL